MWQLSMQFFDGCNYASWEIDFHMDPIYLERNIFLVLGDL